MYGAIRIPETMLTATPNQLHKTLWRKRWLRWGDSPGGAGAMTFTVTNGGAEDRLGRQTGTTDQDDGGRKTPAFRPVGKLKHTLPVLMKFRGPKHDRPGGLSYELHRCKIQWAAAAASA